MTEQQDQPVDEGGAAALAATDLTDEEMEGIKASQAEPDTAKPDDPGVS